jgi:hypothetical protein
VPGPELPLPISAQRQHVDKDRLNPIELDVVGARIRERATSFEYLDLDIEVQERGGLQERERPLVGIGYEGQARVPHNAVGEGTGRAEPRLVDFRGADQPTAIGERFEDTACGHEIIIVRRARGHGTQDLPIDLVDPAARVPERSGVGDRDVHPRKDGRIVMILP